MEKMTITQALAERAIIENRIKREYEEIARYVIRDETRIDPLEKQGGSVKYIESRNEAIKDLIARYMRMMKAIHNFNLTTKLEFAGETRLVDEWLTYHKFMVGLKVAGLGNVQRLVDAALKSNDKIRMVAGKRGESEKPVQVIINLDPAALGKECMNLIEIRDRLWSVLSMLNARSEIEF